MKFVADISVEQKCPCGAILLMWIKIAPHTKYFCTTWHNCLSCGAILRCFDAKFVSILSQFTHFCVEQNLTQTSCPWSTNDKFHVWWRDSTCVFNEYNQAKIIIQMWHYLSFWLLCYVNDPTKQGIIYCFMNLPINIYIKCSGIFHREFFAILNILCNILIFILYYKSWASSWQPFGPALGPSCLLDFVLRAQRAVWPTQRCIR